MAEMPAINGGESAVIAAGGDGGIVKFQREDCLVGGIEVRILQANEPVFVIVRRGSEAAEVAPDDDDAAEGAVIFNCFDGGVDAVTFCDAAEVEPHTADGEADG